MLPLIFMAVEMLLFDNTVLKIKLRYKFMYLFHFVYLLHKTICLKNMIQRLIHDLFHIIPRPMSALACVTGWYPSWYGNDHVLISIYSSVIMHSCADLTSGYCQYERTEIIDQCDTKHIMSMIFGSLDIGTTPFDCIIYIIKTLWRPISTLLIVSQQVR
jgi:hypothetical protein